MTKNVKAIMVPNQILFMHSYQLWILGIQHALRVQVFTTVEVFQACESLKQNGNSFLSTFYY